MIIIVFLKKLQHILRKENISILFGYALSISIITSLLFYHFEHGINKGIKDYYDSLWWTIVTFTTVGYGDISPVSAAGRIIAVFAMILGIGFIGTFMATIASIIIQARGKELTGMKKLQLKNHLIICGYNRLKVTRFIREFRSDVHFQDIPIVLISDSIDIHPIQDEKNVYFVKGESTDEETLIQANIMNASRVIVLAESFQDTKADDKTILTVLLVEELNSEIYTCAEIISPKKKELLRRARCDEIVTPAEISINLMVQALQDPGIPHIVENLVSNVRGQQFHKSKVLADFYQKTFYDLATELLKKELIVFALDKKGDYMVNPPNNTMIEEGDSYYYISKERTH